MHETLSKANKHLPEKLPHLNDETSSYLGRLKLTRYNKDVLRDAVLESLLFFVELLVDLGPDLHYDWTNRIG